MAYTQLISGAMVREGGTKRHHLRLGRAISAIAAAAGVRLDSSGVSRLELALDTPARESVLPFWAAVLATEHLAGPGFGDELRDPADGLSTVWFQASGSEEPRQRWHLDLWVDPAQGNRACLCTWQDRG